MHVYALDANKTRVMFIRHILTPLLVYIYIYVSMYKYTNTFIWKQQVIYSSIYSHLRVKVFAHRTFKHTAFSQRNLNMAIWQIKINVSREKFSQKLLAVTNRLRINTFQNWLRDLKIENIFARQPSMSTLTMQYSSKKISCYFLVSVQKRFNAVKKILSLKTLSLTITF